eukprot:TRINITY_DN62448_c0_g1_i1.p2 TRINITY_DN62448_c0_g1~~TRINITY_DN62448_c0_g1_i1.p2  ORF type:complete len:135 (+),score=27.02 TRINITY_DN62448_c0_g1_i1:49-405(+)
MTKICMDSTTDPDQVQVFRRYQEHLHGWSNEKMHDYWHQTVKYVRIQKCWDRQIKRLEVSVQDNTVSNEVWQVCKKLLLTKFNASERRGIAPNGDLETRIQAMLQKLKISVPLEEKQT